MGFLIVFLGGGLGAALRHGVNLTAARLLGTAEALRKQAGMPIRGPDAALLREYVAAARASVSAQAWDEQRLVGHAWNAEDALAEAGVAR